MTLNPSAQSLSPTHDVCRRVARSGPVVRSLAIAALALAAFWPGRALAAELVMFGSVICEHCENWELDNADIYAKTEEGKRAPLRKVSVDDPRPDDLKNIKRVVFTPTFVLVDDGHEIGRIVGYPGESYFWEYLGQLIAQLDTGPEACPPDAKKIAETDKTKRTNAC